MNKQLERTKSGKLKDNRKVFKGEPLLVEVKFVGTFDGKLDTKTKTLKIYKYHGDITKFGEAIQEYALDNHISIVVTKFNF